MLVSFEDSILAIAILFRHFLTCLDILVHTHAQTCTHVHARTHSRTHILNTINLYTCPTVKLYFYAM